MSMEVSIASKPIHPAVGTQVARSTKELIPVKPASPDASTANHSSLEKPAQPKMGAVRSSHSFVRNSMVPRQLQYQFGSAAFTRTATLVEAYAG
jgi:hypothetical protein